MIIYHAVCTENLSIPHKMCKTASRVQFCRLPSPMPDICPSVPAALPDKVDRSAAPFARKVVYRRFNTSPYLCLSAHWCGPHCCDACPRRANSDHCGAIAGKMQRRTPPRPLAASPALVDVTLISGCAPRAHEHDTTDLQRKGNSQDNHAPTPARRATECGRE